MKRSISEIKEFLGTNHISFEKDVDMKIKTWIKRGGTARIWVQPTNLPDFQKIVNWCQIEKLEFEVIGNTSNCYFLNDYDPSLVISTLKLNKIDIEEKTITCECGYNISQLAKYCISQGIVGFEGFIGLPGTVGGAAINNSGCYECLIADIVKSITILKDGEKIILTNEQMHYCHRSSILKSKVIDSVVLAVTFNTECKEQPSILTKQAIEFQKHRKTYQEHNFLNLGTTFSTLEFKKLPFFKRCINALSQKFITFMVKSPIKKLKLRTKLLLSLLKGGSVSKYISEYGIGCFIWKDEGADEAFKEYVDFIKRNTTKSIIEIEIKGFKINK